MGQEQAHRPARLDKPGRGRIYDSIIDTYYLASPLSVEGRGERAQASETLQGQSP